MAESAALLVAEVFPEQPVRQWVLSFPYPLRFLFARRPAIMGKVLGIVYRAIAQRIARFLERRGLLERNAEHSTLALDTVDEDPMSQLLGHSITYRIAFSLHAGVAAKARERNKLERLCRTITRPVVSEKRLSLTNQGKVRYELKSPYSEGTTHAIFEPVDFIARLAALAPKTDRKDNRYVVQRQCADGARGRHDWPG